MKELTSYNRVAGYLNKIFDLLNSRFFESELSRPTITIQSTPKAYGHFSLRDDTWISKNGCSHEINIGAGTLARPIESVCATLLHEMVHYRTYSDRIRLHIVPALGRLKLQALNAPTVQRFINWMKDGDKETAPLSPKTVKSVHGVLHKALQQALILGYIKTNPADYCSGYTHERKSAPQIALCSRTDCRVFFFYPNQKGGVRMLALLIVIGLLRLVWASAREFYGSGTAAALIVVIAILSIFLPAACGN